MLKLYDRRNQVIELKAIAQIPPPRKAIACGKRWGWMCEWFVDKFMMRSLLLGLMESRVFGMA
jgi:hypothetical protein